MLMWSLSRYQIRPLPKSEAPQGVLLKKFSLPAWSNLWVPCFSNSTSTLAAAHGAAL